jgi:hypothetical protein
MGVCCADLPASLAKVAEQVPVFISVVTAAAAAAGAAAGAAAASAAAAAELPDGSLADHPHR